jgi:predicted N-acyltransferase
LKTTLTFTIYRNTSELPDNWDQIAADNIFLTREYLQVLDLSAPDNMQCHYTAYFDKDRLVGIGLAQFLDVNKLQSFGDRDKCIRTYVRNFLFRNYCSHVLFMGNNMLTGQNSVRFTSEISPENSLTAVRLASEAIVAQYRQAGKKIHLISFKDFPEQMLSSFRKAGFQNYFEFSTQPNMVMPLRSAWKSEADYVGSMSKKYRDQYKRAKKKAAGLEKKKLNATDILKYEQEINSLYKHVAVNAPFNTFFLATNHFRVLKEILKEKFKLYGYFENGRLVGFSTLILNGKVMDTYFLGYDNLVQKEKMLYLNMLYDMIAYSVKKGFEEIVFARTALEIKSSVGAEPQMMFGYMKHTNPAIHKLLPKLFAYLEPGVEWQQRHPFKDTDV